VKLDFSDFGERKLSLFYLFPSKKENHLSIIKINYFDEKE